MIPRSFRARLTLWNVAMLGLVMSGLVFALVYGLRAQQGAVIDQDMIRRARFFAGWALWTPPAPPNQRGGKAVPRNQRGGKAVPQDQRGGAPPPSPPKPPDLPPNKEVERLNWFAEPRFIDAQGRNQGPPQWTTPWDAAAFRETLVRGERFTISRSRGERIRVFSVPVRRDGRIVGVIQVAHALTEFDRLWTRQMHLLSILLPISLLIAGLGGLFLTNRALHPVHLVTQAAAQIGEEDLSRRLSVRGKDELAELAVTFNRMIERLETAFRSRADAYAQLEAAYEQQKRFTADASHELRTPLTRIKTATSAALQGEQSTREYRDALRVADRAANTMARLIDQLLTLARADAGQLRPRSDYIDLGELLRDAGASVPTRAELSFDFPGDPVMVKADGDLLSRVFVNLLENAARHTPAEGRITIGAAVEEGRAVAWVADTGDGIPSEHLPHIFERFYRVDAARSRGAGGTGLGLAICQSIVHAHGGNLVIESHPGEGTRVTVALAPAGRPITKVHATL